MAMKQVVEVARVEAAEQVPKTVRRLMNYFGMSVAELAAVMDSTRQTAYNRLNGTSSFRQEDLAGLSALFGVPIEMLMRGPDDAIRWVLDNPPENLRNRCYPMTAQVAA